MSLPAGETANCVACLKPMTDEERHYYEYRCTGCEFQWLIRLELWRRGEPDAELDELFGDNEQ